jgi:hypothetical protein
MDIPDSAQVFGLGALGGTLVELLRWWKIREADRLPSYASKAGYWVITALMICAGGVMATLYGLDQHHAAALINIGASTPAIIGAVATRPQVSEHTAPEQSHVDLGQKSLRDNRQRRLAMREAVRGFIAFEFARDS